MAKLYFYYSAMNAGKTTTLLQADFNYRERGLKTVLYTAELDNRYKKGEITSRIGLSAPAYLFNEKTNMWNGLRDILASFSEKCDLNNTHENASKAHQVCKFTQKNARNMHCVLIDEAQFLTAEQVDDLARFCDEKNVPVLCYGLRTDFQGNLFEGSKRLLAVADELRELKTICPCGSKATMNLRVDEQGNAIKAGAQTAIGGNESYISLCRKHFYEALNRDIDNKKVAI